MANVESPGGVGKRGWKRKPSSLVGRRFCSACRIPLPSNQNGRICNICKLYEKKGYYLFFEKRKKEKKEFSARSLSISLPMEYAIPYEKKPNGHPAWWVAKEIGVKKGHVINYLIKNKRLIGFKFLNDWFITFDSFNRYLKAKK